MMAGSCERTRASIEFKSDRDDAHDFKHKTNIRFETRDRNTNEYLKKAAAAEEDDGTKKEEYG